MLIKVKVIKNVKSITIGILIMGLNFRDQLIMVVITYS